MKKAVIIGGGFGGIRAALDLSKNKDLEVVLISKNPNFEYYPGLHTIVGVSDCSAYQVPLATIFKNKKIRLIVGEVTDIDAASKNIKMADGESLNADFLILAVGSQTEFFGIPGLAEQAFTFKSVEDAKRLRAQVLDAFKKHVHSDKTESTIGLRFVIVGAGPNGVDIAGELAALGKQLAARYKISESLMSVDLIEGAPRVLPMMPDEVSAHVEKRLRDLGVNVMCNRELKELDSWTVELADEKIGSKTLVWTAGIVTNGLVKKIAGLEIAKKDRVVVDEFLQAKGFENFFILGDAADTPHSGLAQTALHDAQFAARTIALKLRNAAPRAYAPHQPAYNIGAGPRWSVMIIGEFVMYGLPAYVMRTVIDIKFFLSILPISEVWKLYFR